MNPNRSIRFFDEQFRRQVEAHDFTLNPFEEAVLPYLCGSILDYGSGLGNLCVAAARAGCSALALDASPAAIDHIRLVASNEMLPITAEVADLRSYRIAEQFDSVVSIGLLMFFTCPTAWLQLGQIQASVRPGGIAAVNVLVEGTTYMEMFAPEGHCLFKPAELLARFVGWELLSSTKHEFQAPGHTQKVFLNVIARKSHAPTAA